MKRTATVASCQRSIPANQRETDERLCCFDRLHQHHHEHMAVFGKDNGHDLLPVAP